MRNKKRNFKKLSKNIVHPKTRKKIKKIKDKADRDSLYEHSIKSNLEMFLHNFEKTLEKIKDKDKRFYLEVNIGLLKNKVKYFLIDHDRKYKKEILKQIKIIKRELQCSD